MTRRSLAALTSFLFLFRISLYMLSCSRKEVGVTWLDLFSTSMNSLDSSSTDWWMTLNISTQPFKSSPRSTPCCRIYPRPTPNRASSGHSENQSIVEQLIMEGNFLLRSMKAPPRGDMAIIMYMLVLMRDTYWPNMFILLTGILFSTHICMPTLSMTSKSSLLVLMRDTYW